MLQTIKAKAMKKRENGEGGFTLIELMVVVLIIAILLAIAIPTFLGAQNKAKDRAAQSGLRNTLTNAKTIYSDTQTYASADVATLNSLEKGVTAVLTGTASSGPKFISVAGTVSTFTAAAKSAAGECFFIYDDLATGGTGVMFAKTAASTTCSATAAPTAPIVGTPGVWLASW